MPVQPILCVNSYEACPKGTVLVRPGTVILESKSRDGDALADRILRALGARPAESCSKYCAGVALTHAGVPANPMRPLLRRHFSGALSSR